MGAGADILDTEGVSGTVVSVEMPIDDEIKKRLNVEINNRIYTLRSTWLYGAENAEK